MSRNRYNNKSSVKNTPKPQDTIVGQFGDLANIMESITDGFVACDKEWRCVYVNASAARMAGVKKEYLIGKSLYELFPEWVSTPLFREHQRATEEGVPLQFEYFSPGAKRWAQVNLYPSPEGLTAFLTDITERKKAEEAQRQLAAIIETSADAIISKTLTGIITSWNKTAERLFGYTAEQAIGQRITIIIPPELQEEEEEIIRKIEKGIPIQHYETVRVRKNGEKLPISLSISPIKDSKGNIVGAAKVARDITQQKIAEAALQASKERFRALFDLVPVAVYTCDATGVIDAFNQRAVELWGREPEKNSPTEKFCGSFKIFYPDGRFMPHEECPMARVIRGEAIGEEGEEILVERPDGLRRNVVVHPQPLKNERGEIIGAINCLYDITEQKQAEQLRSEQKRELAVTEERQRLARELHDAVSQALFSASVITETLPRLWEGKPERALAQLDPLHQLIQGASAEMRTLLWELRPENIVQTNLSRLLTQLSYAVQVRKKVDISVRARGDDGLPVPPDVHMVFYRIAQESINNVLKHGQATKVNVGLRRTADYSALVVTDNGHGFDMSTVSCGFGLTFMRERAASVGAAFDVKSRVGKGTRVRLLWKAQTVVNAAV